MDPGVLADFGDKGIDERAPCRLGIDRRQMRLGQDLLHNLGGPSGVDQIIDNQGARAVAVDLSRDIYYTSLKFQIVGGSRRLIQFFLC